MIQYAYLYICRSKMFLGFFALFCINVTIIFIPSYLKFENILHYSRQQLQKPHSQQYELMLENCQEMKRETAPNSYAAQQADLSVCHWNSCLQCRSYTSLINHKIVNQHLISIWLIYQREFLYQVKSLFSPSSEHLSFTTADPITIMFTYTV